MYTYIYIYIYIDTYRYIDTYIYRYIYTYTYRLVAVGRIEDARNVLKQMRIVKVVGRSKEANGEYVEITNVDLELDEIVDEVEASSVDQTSW